MPSPNFWSAAVSKGASDVHVVTGYPVIFRVDGVLVTQGKESLSSSAVATLMKKFLSEEQWKRFEVDGDLDCSHMLEDGTRLRINCHRTGGMPAFAARIIPAKIPTTKDVLMPDIVMKLARERDGLVLFTGPTGSGKSTSLAAIIQELLDESPLNIITLEDPVEFHFRPGKGIIRQRELGTDFSSFPEGLKHVLRQDPDVVMVGEMRDLESISLALTLAETGHLVLATLHTPNSSQSIDRIVDVFPPHQQNQVRLQLSLSLKAVIAQRLLPKKNGSRIANREILVRTPAVANIIREHRMAELVSTLQTGQQDGMMTFEKDLKRLVKEGLVEAD
jgi:twitching motility protein PilT